MAFLSESPREYAIRGLRHGFSPKETLTQSLYQNFKNKTLSKKTLNYLLHMLFNVCRNLFNRQIVGIKTKRVFNFFGNEF